tara:strand:- start:2893 stop:3192 length:300 start_codon:yes stop_codon:yes gene_type:complete
MNIEENQIFSSWTKREVEALKTGLYKLEKSQPPKKVIRIKTGVVGCHYRRDQHCYIVNASVDGKNVYAGRMKEFDADKARAMQRATQAAYGEKIISFKA